MRSETATPVASTPQENFPVDALYRSVPDSVLQSPIPSWKKPREILSCVVEAKDETERLVKVLVPLVAVMEPAVMEPMVAVGPEDEPVRLPVTLPERFPKRVPLTVMLLRTKRLVVVAVFETTRLVVEADVVAVIDPAVMEPMFAVGPEEEPVRLPVTLPVTLPVRFPVMPLVTTRFVVVAVPLTTNCDVDALVVAVSVPMVAPPRVADGAVMSEETERFAVLRLVKVPLVPESPRKVEVPEVAVKLKPTMEPKTSSIAVEVVELAPMSTCAEEVEGR